MKAKITKDELFPWYVLDTKFINPNYGEVPDDLIAEYESVTQRFFELQEKLEAIYDGTQ